MNEQEYASRPNKSQQKREIKVLNKLGQDLAALPLSTLKKFPLSAPMFEAVLDAKRFSRGALQRQLRRIASLMQHEDVDAIRLELERLKMPSKEQTAEQHLLESWRDKLIAGDEALLTEIIDQYPEVDRQAIRQLVRNAQMELKRNKPPKSSRQLFRFLSQLRREHAVTDSEQSDESMNSDPSDDPLVT
jgi:ribosome-associated protein